MDLLTILGISKGHQPIQHGPHRRGRWRGKAGQHIRQSYDAGHTILNSDLMALDHPAVHTLKADLADCGQVFNALSSRWALAAIFPAGLPPRPTP